MRIQRESAIRLGHQEAAEVKSSVHLDLYGPGTRIPVAAKGIIEGLMKGTKS